MRAALETVDAAEAIRASGDHPLIAHLSASPTSPPMSWRCGRAVAIADAYWGDVSVCAVGPVPDVVALVDSLAEHEHWISVPDDAAAALPDDLLADRHGWAFRWTSAPTGTSPGAAAWLAAAEEPEVAELLAIAFPDASIGVGNPKARRWAGIRDLDGSLVACAVDATDEPSVGFVASIATRPDARGRGLGTLVTGWVVDRLLEEHHRAGLWVYQENDPAKAVYDRLGMAELRLTAGALRGARHRA